jgi:hypothetical protein
VTVTGCDSILTQGLSVLDLPDVIFNVPADETVCLEGETISLTGSPSGGEFLGDGITENNFIPASAGIGEHMLYYFYEDDNCCKDIDSVQINVVDCLGLSVQKRDMIKVYPNPFNDFTTIDFGRELTVDDQILVYNTLGEEVYRNVHAGESKLVFTKKEFEKGVYFLSLVSDKETIFTVKLIVQ